MARILGIDEAGRGCVLGGLYVGAFLTTLEAIPHLEAAGVTDSKRLSPRRRETLRRLLPEYGTTDLRVIPAEAIDTGNLNRLEEDAIVSLIEATQPDAVMIDALGHPRTLDATVQRLRDRLGAHAPLLAMEPKADANHRHVGAASIVAKEARDEALQELKAIHGELGSGYPSDPKTRLWLTTQWAAHRRWPSFVRTRWGTITDIEGA